MGTNVEVSAGVGVIISPDSAESADVRVGTGAGTIIGVNVGPGVEASVDIGILVEIGVRLGVDVDAGEDAVSFPHPMILKANIITGNDRTTAAISVFIQSAPLSSDSAKKVDMLNSS